MTLDDALTIHIYNTRDVRIQRMAYENAMLEYGIYRKSLLPSVQFDVSPLSFNHSMKMLQSAVSGEYTNVDEFSNSTSAGITVRQTIGATGGVLSLGSSLSYLREFSSETNSFSARPLFVSYSQQLFGGRKSFRYKKTVSEKTRDKAVKDYVAAVTAEEQTIVRLYMDALTAKTDREYYTRVCSIGDTLVTHARLRLRSGAIIEYDCNQVELQQMANRMSLVKSNKEYVNALRLLEMELGLEDIDVCEPKGIAFPIEMSWGHVMELARKNNVEYIENDLQRMNAEYTLYSTRLTNSFNASVSLTYGLNQYGRTLGEAYKRPNQQQAVSITLAIPVFEWGAGRDRIRIARNKYEAAVMQQERAMESFERRVLESVNAYNRSVEAMGIAEKRYALARRQFEFAVKSFAVGKLGVVELSSAESELLRAKQEFVGVQRELYATYYQIRHIAVYDFINDKDIEIKLYDKEG